MKISEGKSEIFKAIASFRKALKQPLKMQKFMIDYLMNLKKRILSNQCPY